MRTYSRGAFLVVLVLAAVAAQGDVTMPSLISDHMVLQSGQEANIWGWAEPGEEVTLAWLGINYKATANGDGDWRIVLPPQEAGGPYYATIYGDGEPIKIDDILVGEVWVCSGQSNMEWRVSSSNNSDHEIQLSNYPKLRWFAVENTVAAEAKKDCEGAWVTCGADTVGDFSAVGYFFARHLYQKLAVPVGMIQSDWGGTPAESWTTQSSLEADPMFVPILERWEKTMEAYPEAQRKFEAALATWEKAKKKGESVGAKPRAPWHPEHPWRPSGLYNAMIAPLTPYAITGAIWYQGESNAGRAFQYRTLFPRMIQDWRDAWGIGDFPFYFVQLANFTPQLPEPGDSDWAELREAQTMTLDLPKTAMAVTIDIGEADDIHPRNKQDVGTRLALNALDQVYRESPPYFSPVYYNMFRRGDNIVVWLEHAYKGLEARGGGELKGFAIAGADRKFVWAKAEIVGQRRVRVWSDYVRDPVAVRYGWANNPDCNLVNGVGLPASPFRTDEWPGVTVEKR